MSSDQNFQITVVLGIYNGEKYLESLNKQLSSQTNQNFKLLVLDNCSTDKSWDTLQEWRVQFPNRILLHRNATNLGAGGSFDSALRGGLVTTPWFAMMHQDDIYLPNHLEVLIKEIEVSENDVVGICTSMGSISNLGEIRSTPPRAAWLMKDDSRINSFLANLRVQTYSFPTAAARTEEFVLSLPPWHSPSFSDTETTLNLLGFGKIKYLKIETHKYRENPDSESHVINSLEATVGAAIALTRVFSSSAFKEILKLVPANDRGKFFVELISGIEQRLKSSILSEFVKILATEQCCLAWGYTELESNSFLSAIYRSVGSKFTSEMLERRVGLQSQETNTELEIALRELSKQSGIATFGRSMISNKSNFGRRIMSILPVAIRARLFRVYVHLRAIKQPDYYWNIFWK